MTAQVLTVNIGNAQANAHKRTHETGIGKVASASPVQVRDPGSREAGLGSGLVGDFIGDRRHHGGEHQAVYAFAREDLDHWQAALGTDLPNGYFGENLTLVGIDPNTAVLGEIWQIGPSVQLTVTVPRLPCATFRGWVGRPGWLKDFTAEGRPGAYFSVHQPGTISSGDPVTVVHRPDHTVTIAQAFAAMTTARETVPSLAAAGDDLVPELRTLIAAHEVR